MKINLNMNLPDIYHGIMCGVSIGGIAIAVFSHFETWMAITYAVHGIQYFWVTYNEKMFHKRVEQILGLQNQIPGTITRLDETTFTR